MNSGHVVRELLTDDELSVVSTLLDSEIDELIDYVVSDELYELDGIVYNLETNYND